MTRSVSGLGMSAPRDKKLVFPERLLIDEICEWLTTGSAVYEPKIDFFLICGAAGLE